MSDAATETEIATPSVMSAWDRVKLARHPQRPHTLDYLNELIADFVELHGDRTFGDDAALIGGIGRLGQMTVMVLGHQKGSNTRENLDRNFGMPHPEGYRKAHRLLRQAEKFGIPVITFIDTPAADPGLGSEERGQATAIAEALLAMANLRVPIVATVIGEGGSGGALAIGLADRILMLENAVYAVASPEACASILWRDAAKASEAAETMRITAADLARFGIVDEVIAEAVPAHEQPRQTVVAVGAAITRQLAALIDTYQVANPTPADLTALLDARYAKFRRIGVWRDTARTELGLPADEISQTQ